MVTLGTAVSLNQIMAGSTIHLADNGGASGGTIVNDGTITLSSGTGSGAIFNPSNFVNNGTIIDIGGGIPAALGEDLELTPLTSFEDGPTGKITVGEYGLVHINGPNGSVDVSGTISVTGNATVDLDTASVAVSDTLGNAGVIQLSTGGTAEINYDYKGTVAFLDATGVLALGQQGGAYTGKVAGLSRINAGTHDNIDLLLTSSVTSVMPAFTSPTGGVLYVMDNTTTLASINIIGNYVGQAFNFGSDGSNGTDVFLGCFTAGTRILTERGEIAVENLRVGDRAVTLSGRGAVCKPVRWIGVSRIDIDRHPAPHTVSPIRVREGAFGDGRPCRDLRLSPDHSVYVDEVLISVHHLVNGATVRRESVRGVVAYYHVELDAHDVLVADGLPAESYLDTGNRADFDNGGGVRALHRTFAAQVWSERACAALVTEGAALAAVRARLAARADELGFVTTEDADVAFAADGGAVAAERLGAHRWRCTLPAGARALRITSRSFIPDERDAAAGDARRLGVALVALRIDGAAVALDDAALADGFHPTEAGASGVWRWTDGDALIRVPPAGPVYGARVVDVETLPMACPYWTEPATDAVERRLRAAG